MLPFEFVVIGEPVSHQNKVRKRVNEWKKLVRETAQSYWNSETPLADFVQVIITHYYDADPGDESAVPDSDNIVKPIIDALNGLIYIDDFQISDFISRRRNLNGSFRIKSISPALAKGFSNGEEFLHIKIEAAPDPGDLNFTRDKSVIFTTNNLEKPFEFVVIGKPVSYLTKGRKRLIAWKKKVRDTAESYWNSGTPLRDNIQITITYYYNIAADELAFSDFYNIVKPICNALNSLIYVDEYQITEFIGRRRNLNGSFRIQGISSAQAEGFSQGEEFLHIRIKHLRYTELHSVSNLSTEDIWEKENKNYYLTSTLSVKQISIGAKLIVNINLISKDINSNDGYLIEFSDEEATANELNIILNAPGFQLKGDNTASLPLLDTDTVQETQTVWFELTALRPGNATISVEIYRGDIFETKLKTQIQIADIDEAAFSPQRITTQPRPAPQPDFIFRIQTIENETNSTCKFQYQLRSFRLPSLFPGNNIYTSSSLSRNWIKQVRGLLINTLENISGSLSQEKKSRLISLGQYLFKHLFPTELQGDIRSLIPRNSTFTFLILTNEDTSIPWALLHDGQRFFAERFIIGRWLSELNDTRPYEFPVGAINIAHYANVKQPELWETLLQPPGAPPPQPLPEGVLHDSTQAIPGLHLIRYSHSEDITDLRNAPVRLDNPSDAEEIETKIRPAKLNLRRNRPFVTLSYIKTDTLELTELEQTWASAFISAGCSGFAGSMWAVEASVEAAFISSFYNSLWTGASLGEAFYTSRQLARAVAPDSLDWLAYVLFGDPMARPYLPVEGKGYAVVEPIGREIEDPLPPNVPIRFRLSLRRTPPVWHQERVIEVAENLTFENLQVHVKTMGLQVTPDSPIEMNLAPNGNYLGWFTLVAPPEMVDNSALVQVYFMDGEIPIHSLMFSLTIENNGGE